jgi:hypothetical protein
MAPSRKTAGVFRGISRAVLTTARCYACRCRHADGYNRRIPCRLQKPGAKPVIADSFVGPPRAQRRGADDPLPARFSECHLSTACKLSKLRRSVAGPPPGRRRTAAGPPPDRRGPPPDRRRAAAGPPRAAAGPPLDRRRTAAGPPPDRRQNVIGPPPDRCRIAGGPPAGRRKPGLRVTAGPQQTSDPVTRRFTVVPPAETQCPALTGLGAYFLLV